MIFAIAQHSSDLKLEARITMDAAIAVALELGINSREFAEHNGEGNPVLEESWRRTYYFLHLTDQHFAVVVNSPFFAMRDIPTIVDLPCDDEYYELGVSTKHVG
jgi:nicotinate-nucleotide pyrophosphorylase (carboxylating)